MQFTTFIATLVSAALAASAALPAAHELVPNIMPLSYSSAEPYTMPQGSPPTVGAQCGQSQEKVACCNGDGSGSGLLGLNLLGGSCSLNLLGGSCSQGSLACCPVSQSAPSLISIGAICAPISL